jgi:hypothetical protein
MGLLYLYQLRNYWLIRNFLQRPVAFCLPGPRFCYISVQFHARTVGTEPVLLRVQLRAALGEQLCGTLRSTEIPNGLVQGYSVWRLRVVQYVVGTSNSSHTHPSTVYRTATELHETRHWYGI